MSYPDEEILYAEYNKTYNLSCSHTGTWYIFNESNNSLQDITNDKINYNIIQNYASINRKTKLQIFKPKNNTIFILENSHGTVKCNYRIRTFVYPEQYKAILRFNNNPPFNGSFNNSGTSTYKINLTIDDPLNFAICFTYRLEGIPIRHLHFNNKPLMNANLCNSTISEFKCLEASKSENFTKLTNEIKWYFSYSRYKDDISQLDQKVRIGQLEIIINILYPPKYSPNETITFKENEKKLLNCSPLYSNPEVEKYLWYSSNKEYNETNKSTNLFTFVPLNGLDRIVIFCKAYNWKFSAVKRFELIRHKNEPVIDELSTLAKVGISVVVLFVIAITACLGYLSYRYRHKCVDFCCKCFKKGGNGNGHGNDKEVIPLTDLSKYGTIEDVEGDLNNYLKSRNMTTHSIKGYGDCLLEAIVAGRQDKDFKLQDLKSKMVEEYYNNTEKYHKLCKFTTQAPQIHYSLFYKNLSNYLHKTRWDEFILAAIPQLITNTLQIRLNIYSSYKKEKGIKMIRIQHFESGLTDRKVINLHYTGSRYNVILENGENFKK